jgi:hypothetical protein
MPLESVTHISDLNISNPPGTDGLSQADDHLRNIKIALKTDFPGITGVVNSTQAQLNRLNSIAAQTFLANATNGAAAPTEYPLNLQKIVYLLNDQNFASTTLANITDFTNIATLDADTIYLISAAFDYKPTANGGFKMGYVLSQTAQAGRFIHMDADGPIAGLEYFFNPFTAAPLIDSLGSGSNERVVMILPHSWIHTHLTLTSTLTFQGALHAASGSVDLKRGSSVIVTRLGVA